MLWKPLISFSWWLSWFCRTFWGGSGAMRTPGGTKLRVCVGVEREVWDQRGVPSVSIKQSKAKAAPGQSSTLPTTSIQNLLVPTSLVNRGAYKKNGDRTFWTGHYTQLIDFFFLWKITKHQWWNNFTPGSRFDDLSTFPKTRWDCPRYRTSIFSASLKHTFAAF